jgi:hypothetical protein
MREHDVTALTAAELEAARRELAASLARPGSPVHARSGPAWPPSTPNWPDVPPPGPGYPRHPPRLSRSRRHADHGTLLSY